MLLNIIIIIVFFIYIKRYNEGLTTYLKYKDISNNFSHKISGDTDCIYTEIPPQISKIYNVDYNSPFDRYNVNNINSEYNKPYYDNKSIDIDINVTKKTDNTVVPFFKIFTYCELNNNKPTCTYTSCGISEEKHDKSVAELMNKKRLEKIQVETPKFLNEINKNLINYNNNNIISNNYLSSI